MLIRGLDLMIVSQSRSHSLSLSLLSHSQTYSTPHMQAPHPKPTQLLCNSRKEGQEKCVCVCVVSQSL